MADGRRPCAKSKCGGGEHSPGVVTKKRALPASQDLTPRSGTTFSGKKKGAA